MVEVIPYCQFTVQVLARPHRAGESRGCDPCVERTHPILSSPLLMLALAPRHTFLARLRLFNQASVEATNVFGARARVLPFGLDIIHLRAKYWGGLARARRGGRYERCRTLP